MRRAAHAAKPVSRQSQVLAENRTVATPDDDDDDDEDADVDVDDEAGNAFFFDMAAAVDAAAQIIVHE